MGLDSLHVVINAVASINAFLLFLFLLLRKNNSLPSYALSGIMLIPALYFANSLLMFNGLGNQFPVIFFVVQLLAIFYAPCTSVYVFSLLGKEIRKLKYIFIISGIIGLIPICLFMVYMTWESEHKALFFRQLVNGPYPNSVTFYSIVFYGFQQLVFIYLLITVNRTQKNVLLLHSSMGSSKIGYLRNFMLLLVILNCIIVVLYIFFDVLFVEYLLLPLIVTSIYSFLIFYTFRNSAILNRQQFEEHLASTAKINDSSTLILEQAENEQSQLIVDIKTAINEQQLYKDPELSLAKLAESVGYPINTVSHAINNGMDSTFYDLINSKRIEESKRLLLRDTLYTMEGIGYEVGFKSRATFYRAFKKYTNMSPKSFINNKEN